MKNDLNERIHDLRERTGITQTDLAMRIGVTRSCVNAWEMGVSKPGLDNLKTLARIFHTTTDYLLGYDDHDTISIEEKELIMCLIHYIEGQHEISEKSKK